MLVRDENKLPITSSDGLWNHIVKTLFVTADGLGTLQSVLTVAALDPLTMGKLHLVDHDDIEEVWTTLRWHQSLRSWGITLRKRAPGMSFYHIPDNKTPHTNINQNEDCAMSRSFSLRSLPPARTPQSAVDEMRMKRETFMMQRATALGYLDCIRADFELAVRWRRRKTAVPSQAARKTRSMGLIPIRDCRSFVK